MKDINWQGLTISVWILIGLIYFLWVAGLLVIKKIVFWTVLRLVRKTKTKFDDIIVRALNLPVTLLIFISGGLIVERLTQGSHVFPVIFKATTVVAIIIFIDRFLIGLINRFSDKVELLRASGIVTRGFVHVIIFGIGGLVLLDTFGISVTPVIASLGIGSLAVALALQPMLENFFSGIQIVVDKPFQIGQFIKLETGEEGYVDKIGWRSTWVRMSDNKTIIIPNKSMVNSRVINYYYPTPDMSIVVEVGVHYESDLERVERVTIEVARETLRSIAGGVSNFEPFIRFHTLAPYSINFAVVLRVKEIVDSSPIKHEFIKRLIKRYAHEGIIIPFPIEAVNYSQEKAFEQTGKD